MKIEQLINGDMRATKDINEDWPTSKEAWALWCNGKTPHSIMNETAITCYLMFNGEKSGKEQIFIEARSIVEPTIRDFVLKALAECNVNFFTMPASRTGKHHPEQSLGEGGLVRHVLAALYFARELCLVYSANDYEVDIIKAAIILHDIGKAVAEPHDIVAATALRRLAKDEPVLLRVIEGVRWHMGRWSTGSTNCQEGERGSKKFPDDFTRTEQIIHLADYAASRKRLKLIKLGTV